MFIVSCIWHGLSVVALSNIRLRRVSGFDYLGVSSQVWLFLAVLIRLEFGECDFISMHVLISLFWLL